MSINTLSYCLLCAEDTSTNNNSTYSISDSSNGIKDTLVACAQWRESFESDTMPRVVCETCSDELFRCSRFFEQITRAEQKLIMLQGNIKQETPLEIVNENWYDDYDPMDGYDPLNEQNNDDPVKEEDSNYEYEPTDLNEPLFNEVLLKSEPSVYNTRSANKQNQAAEQGATENKQSVSTGLKKAASTKEKPTVYTNKTRKTSKPSEVKLLPAVKNKSESPESASSESESSEAESSECELSESESSKSGPSGTSSNRTNNAGTGGRPKAQPTTLLNVTILKPSDITIEEDSDPDNSESLTCKKCGKIFPNPVFLRVHKKVVCYKKREFRPYRCDLCLVTYKNVYSIKKHMKKHEGNLKRAFNKSTPYN